VAGVLERHAEKAGDELAHALVDLGEQVALGGVERVVEIEDPNLRALEAAALSLLLPLAPALSPR
jgi:hypothetical protein